jgi:hypothetical protein
VEAVRTGEGDAGLRDPATIGRGDHPRYCTTLAELGVHRKDYGGEQAEERAKA